MSCPSVAKLGTPITFTVNTRTVPLGTPRDADAVPAYEIYEENDDTPIVTGNLAKIGDQVGFYGVAVDLLAADGFEVDKTYIVRITATVAGRDGAKSYAFAIIN